MCWWDFCVCICAACKNSARRFNISKKLSFISIQWKFAAGSQYSLTRLPESIASLGVPDLLRDSEAKLLLWLGCIEQLLGFVLMDIEKVMFHFWFSEKSMKLWFRFAFRFNPCDWYKHCCSFDTHSFFRAFSQKLSLLICCALKCFHWTIHCTLP